MYEQDLNDPTMLIQGVIDGLKLLPYPGPQRATDEQVNAMIDGLIVDLERAQSAIFPAEEARQRGLAQGWDRGAQDMYKWMIGEAKNGHLQPTNPYVSDLPPLTPNPAILSEAGSP